MAPCGRLKTTADGKIYIDKALICLEIILFSPSQTNLRGRTYYAFLKSQGSNTRYKILSRSIGELLEDGEERKWLAVCYLENFEFILQKRGGNGLSNFKAVRYISCVRSPIEGILRVEGNVILSCNTYFVEFLDRDLLVMLNRINNP